MYSKYAGTEVALNDHSHLVLKEDDVIGILETDDVKDMKPLNDRVLIKVVISYLFGLDIWFTQSRRICARSSKVCIAGQAGSPLCLHDVSLLVGC